MLKIVILTVLVASVLGIAFYIWWGNQTSKVDDTPKDITLSVWSIYEDEGTMRMLMDEYTRLHPNVKFAYRYQPLTNYRSRVATQIAANQGPDVFMIHNSWLGMFGGPRLLSALPSDVMTSADYAGTFYPTLRNSFESENNIYGISQGVDGLGLYINLDILSEVKGVAPKDWREFTDLAVKMSRYSEEGEIIRAGAAIGTTDNVSYWSDILGLLYLQQPGADLNRPAEGNGPEVLNFYTDFAKDGSKKVWDRNLGGSVKEFAAGKVGMIFGPSSVINELTVLNPRLRFVVANVPQRPGKLGEDVNWGSYWGWTVSRSSIAKSEAWDFLRFITTREMEVAAFSNSLEVAKVVGQPYSRIDLAGELSADTKLGAFVRQAPMYKSWYLNFGTEDKGWNDKTIELYKTATVNVLNGADSKKELEDITDSIKEAQGAL